MNLIAFSIALIAIVFGAKLLAQSQKENLAALYKYLSWFVMAAGFLVLLYVGAWGLIHVAERSRGGMQKEMRMKMGDDKMGCGPMWMHGNRGNMNCCNGMMNCCGSDMMNCHDGNMNCGGNSNCSDGMMNGGGNCTDGKMSSCTDGGKGDMGSCPMMGNMKGKMDSAKAKPAKK